MSRATINRPTHPGCRPLVPTKTKADPASIEAATVASSTVYPLLSDDCRASQSSRTAIPHPKIVSICQLAHRMRALDSLKILPPLVGTKLSCLILRNIRISPSTVWKSPTIKAMIEALKKYQFILKSPSSLFPFSNSLYWIYYLNPFFVFFTSLFLYFIFGVTPHAHKES
jgi:hypothetical protein